MSYPEFRELKYFLKIDALIQFNTMKTFNKLCFDRTCLELFEEKTIYKIFGKLLGVHTHRSATFVKLERLTDRKFMKIVLMFSWTVFNIL